MKNELDANHPVELKVYGTTRGARGYTIRDFLTRGDVPFEWVQVTGDDQARAIGLENMEDPRLPVCVFFDGSWVDCPTIRQIAEKLGWYRNPSLSKYDRQPCGGGSSACPPVLREPPRIAAEAARSVVRSEYLNRA